jgi:hypothetical protein
VQSLLLFNIGDSRRRATDTDHYLGSNVSYKLKKLADRQKGLSPSRVQVVSRRARLFVTDLVNVAGCVSDQRQGSDAGPFRVTIDNRAQHIAMLDNSARPV